jgi:succinyl-diaminopimelate desuccinylase
MRRNHIMLEFLRTLVAIDTNVNEAKNYSQCAAAIAKQARSLGFSPKIHHAEAPDGKPRPNVLINMDSGAEKTLLINAHFDIVPAGDGWKTDPFELVVEGERAFGRGTSDDKGGIAATLYSISESKPKVNLQLAYTCDEEIGGHWGLGDLVRKKLIYSDAALIVDGSPAATVASSGVVMGRLHFKGKGGHAGKPFEADNPVPCLISFLQELESYPEERSHSISPYSGLNKKRIFGRFSLTTLKGSEKENAIAGDAYAGFDLRVNPGEEVSSVLAQFKERISAISKKTGIIPELKLITQDASYNSSGAFVEKMKKLTNTDGDYGTWGANDGHHTASIMPTVAFGASRTSDRIHAADEFVSLKELEYAKGIVKKIAEEGW